MTPPPTKKKKKNKPKPIPKTKEQEVEEEDQVTRVISSQVFACARSVQCLVIPLDDDADEDNLTTNLTLLRFSSTQKLNASNGCSPYYLDKFYCCQMISENNLVKFPCSQNIWSNFNVPKRGVQIWV